MLRLPLQQMALVLWLHLNRLGILASKAWPSSTMAFSFLQTTRPKFLISTPIYGALGLSSAWRYTKSIAWPLTLLRLVTATLAHITANVLNKYYGHQSGVDLNACKTDFSGGSGFLPVHGVSVPTGLKLRIGVLLVTLVFAGLVIIISAHGGDLLILGVLGVAIVVSYTAWLNRSPVLCWPVPGFGLIMVLASDFALTGQLRLLDVLLGVMVYFLANKLRLLNQLPDATADQATGRYPAVRRLGATKASWLYLLGLFSSALVLAVVVVHNQWPPTAWWLFAPFSLGLFAWHRARQYGFMLGQYRQYLTANVRVALLLPCALHDAILISR